MTGEPNFQEQAELAGRGRMLLQQATFDAEAVEELERMFSLRSDDEELESR